MCPTAVCTFQSQILCHPIGKIQKKGNSFSPICTQCCSEKLVPQIKEICCTPEWLANRMQLPLLPLTFPPTFLHVNGGGVGGGDNGCHIKRNPATKQQKRYGFNGEPQKDCHRLGCLCAGNEVWSFCGFGGGVKVVRFSAQNGVPFW